MKLSKAKAIAEKYKAMLAPYCTRIEIAGSIRREKPEVKDIEIVAVRSTRELFGFVDVVSKLKKVKGEPTGKYTQRELPEGIKLDLFMVDLDNFGLQLAIRTGSADFSHKVLASGWVKKGYYSEGGYLFSGDNLVPVRTCIREEEDLFELIGIPYVEPHKREV